jgi:hypothetical protein
MEEKQCDNEMRKTGWEEKREGTILEDMRKNKKINEIN